MALGRLPSCSRPLGTSAWVGGGAGRPGRGATAAPRRGGRRAVPCRRAEIGRVVVPRAAADDARDAVGLGARLAVEGKAVEGDFVAVVNPLPGVAGHVAQPEGIGGVPTGRRGEGPTVVAAGEPGATVAARKVLAH